MEKILKMSLILSAVDKMTAVVDKAYGNASKKMQSMQRVSSGMRNAGAAASVAGGIIIGALAGTITAAEGAATAQARLEQVFRSMGDTTGRGAADAMKYADSLELITGVDGDLIMLSQAKLATFAEVSSETARMAGIFDRATAATVDLAAAGFGDAASNAVQLGKALNDPIKGITAMTRSGITFTKVEQEKIKMLTLSGRQLEAQNIILAAVEKQVGGVAAATANDSEKMKVAFGQISESVGMALLPALNQFTAWLQKVTPHIRSFIENNSWFVKGIAALGIALSILGPILLVASSAVTVFSAALWANPITWIVAAVIAAAVGLTLLIVKFRKIEEWFMSLKGWQKILILVFAAPLIPLLTIIKGVYWLIDNWNQIPGYFMQLWDWVKRTFNSAWEFIKGLFLKYHPYGILYNNWSGVVAWFGELWNNVTARFNQFVSFLASLPSVFYNAGVNIVMSIWDGMAARFDSMIQWFEQKINVVREYLPFSPAKRGPLSDIHKMQFMETIAASIKPQVLVDKMEQATGAAKGALMASASSPVNTANSTSINSTTASNTGASLTYAPVININGAATEGDRQGFMAMLKDHEYDIARMLQSISDRDSRKSFA